MQRLTGAAVALLALTLTASPGLARSAGPTGADAFSAVGTMLDLPEGARAWIVHARTPQLEASAAGGEFLYPGDKVRVRGAKVELLLEGNPQPVPIDEANSPYTVPATARRSLSQDVRDFVATISWPLAKRSFVRRRPTSGRGGPGDAAGSALVPVRASPVIPAGRIVIPKTLDHLTITWCGDAAYGEAKAANDAALVEDAGGYGRISSLNRPLIQRVVVHDLGSRGSLDYEIVRVEARDIPAPGWFRAPRGATADDRVAYGLWLLTQPDAAYRAYGLTLLDDEKYEVAAAAQYFSAATDCPAS